ncbi:cytidylate kinase family protein [Proteiniclasticum sediminis]|uniref:cytidylate kinase family protein n=1 Tax=Proteiniclasticum sediminis TaxID=2804028 RepID=UPI001E58C9F5|nr:cytidylate kinase family protein [Proteiniclasticum sediminis]
MGLILITISRQTGSLGDEVAKVLAQRLEIPHITRRFAVERWFPEIAGKHDLHMLLESPAYYLRESASGVTFSGFLEEKLKTVVEEGSAVISGMGSQLLFKDHPQAIHVRIIGSTEVRVERVMKENRLIRQDAEKIIEFTDRKHKKYIRTVFNRDWADPQLYDLTFNTDHLGVSEIVAFIEELAKKRLEAALLPKEAPENGGKPPVVFKNPSEEEFAKILDLYNLEWEYEPRTFPIRWDAEGNITQAFSPDFYLPRFDTYLELTVMTQKYTATKKKKAELLRKLYPGTNIRIVFKDDFHSLIKRLGHEEGEED